MKKGGRIDWIDVAKGIGIILVVMGHCFNKTSLLHRWIFSFHMPLFFILSGYCFNIDRYHTLGDVIQNKFKSLLVPYLGFCILGITVSLIIPEWREAFSISGILTDIYCAYPTLTNITSTWFLVALFILSVLLYSVVRISRKYNIKWFPYLFVGLSGFFGFLITVIRKMFFVSADGEASAGSFSLPGGRLPLTLDTCMTALVFFALGYWTRNHLKNREIGHKKKVCFSMMFFACNVLVGVKLNTRVNLHGCTYGNVFFFYIAALAGTAAVVFLSQIICGNCWLKQLFIFYGRNSLFILGMQSLLIHLYVYILNKSTENSYELYETIPTIHGWYAFLLITVVALPILCCFKECIKKFYDKG